MTYRYRSPWIILFAAFGYACATLVLITYVRTSSSQPGRSPALPFAMATFGALLGTGQVLTLRNRRIVLEGNRITGYDMLGKPTVIDLEEGAALHRLPNHQGGVKVYELRQRGKLVKFDSMIQGFDELLETLRQRLGECGGREGFDALTTSGTPGPV